jgi:hypothetical protein
MSSGKGLYERLRDVDRRVIFLAIALAVVVPMLFQVTFPEFPSKMVQDAFDKVESLPPGAKVLLSFDYDPSSEPELQPMATAWVRQCVKRGYKMYIMALWPIGQQMAAQTLEQVLTKELPGANYRKGVDYVNLGYKSGNQGVIKVVLTDFEKLYNTDGDGTYIRDVPAMRGVKNLRAFDLIINISAGTPGLKEWIQFGSTPARVPIVGGSTAVQAPQMYPYYPDQMVGVLGGLKAASEYEELVRRKYPEFQDDAKNAAIVRMGPQAVAHIVIILFIVLGNVTYLVDKRRGRRP